MKFLTTNEIIDTMSGFSRNKYRSDLENLFDIKETTNPQTYKCFLSEVLTITWQWTWIFRNECQWLEKLFKALKWYKYTARQVNTIIQFEQYICVTTYGTATAHAYKSNICLTIAVDNHYISAIKFK